MMTCLTTFELFALKKFTLSPQAGKTGGHTVWICSQETAHGWETAHSGQKGQMTSLLSDAWLSDGLPTSSTPTNDNLWLPKDVRRWERERERGGRRGEKKGEKKTPINLGWRGLERACSSCCRGERRGAPGETRLAGIRIQEAHCQR